MDKWRQELDKTFGDAPAASVHEFQQILQRAHGARPQTVHAGSLQIWPSLICFAALALAILVSILVKPVTTETSNPEHVMLSIEAVSLYEESLDNFQYLAGGVE